MIATLHDDGFGAVDARPDAARAERISVDDRDKGNFGTFADPDRSNLQIPSRVTTVETEQLLRPAARCVRRPGSQPMKFSTGILTDHRADAVTSANINELLKRGRADRQWTPVLDAVEGHERSDTSSLFGESGIERGLMRIVPNIVDCPSSGCAVHAVSAESESDVPSLRVRTETDPFRIGSRRIPA
ncbi:hypothetical protein [Kribbella flavida]|uniref:hypothetical protein n=1 Tax=Kribbella flavida TaxID=182640 RepID=UPI0011D1A24B|nr:hypothetical protein [Kribbella flavida]